jgi:hypothetical protein
MMAMVFCRGCGKQIHETAPACPSCGAPQVVAPAPGAGAAKANSAPPEVVSAGWKKKFALIDKAGGVDMPNASKLTFWQRFTVKYNFWAFLFGPIYYMVKGMWKRAITLTGAAIVLTIVLAVVAGYFHRSFPGIGLLAPIMFGVFANEHYYKKVVQRNNGWW